MSMLTSRREMIGADVITIQTVTGRGLVITARCIGDDSGFVDVHDAGVRSGPCG
jgi:hypothetical protein